VGIPENPFVVGVRGFRATLLEGANLIAADVSWTRLSGANLSGADLSGANLKGAKLSGANLEGANLTGAKAIEATTWPDGFDPEAAGVVFD
jgi:uncharacterized protein YjbI with pentapeptide repeats